VQNAGYHVIGLIANTLQDTVSSCQYCTQSLRNNFLDVQRNLLFVLEMKK